jgi:glutaredoxin
VSATLTLYSKPGCHLCEDARQLAGELQPEFGFAIEEIDITGDEELFARYRYEIPVMLLDGVEIARGRIGERDLLEKLRRLTSG